MATKKSQSINSQLISGAYKAARSGGYQKSNFKLDLDGVADMLTAKAAANQKLQEEAEEMLDFQPALGKIGENDQGPLLNYFSGVKNEMAIEYLCLSMFYLCECSNNDAYFARGAKSKYRGLAFGQQQLKTCRSYIGNGHVGCSKKPMV